MTSSPDPSTAAAAALDRRTSAWVLGAVVLLTVALRLPLLGWDNRSSETDEGIYWQLAASLVRGDGYTLQRAPILETLSPGMYDRPVFHHPPLYPALLVPFVLLDSPRWAIVVSWLGPLLAVLAVFLVARSRGHAARSAALLLPVLGVALDPLMSFVARKLWIDGILAGLVAMSFACLLVAPREGRRSGFLLASGAFLGLAGLAKLTALVLAPVLVLGAWVRFREVRTIARDGALLLLPVAFLVVPWLVYFRIRCGAFLPWWAVADAWLLERYPFVKTLLGRPWYYYVRNLALYIPVLPLAALHLLLLKPRGRWVPLAVTSAAWFVAYVGAITVVSARGVGFLMRHMVPAVPAIYLLVLGALEDLPPGRVRRWVPVAYAVAIALGVIFGIPYWYRPAFDDMIDFPAAFRRWRG